MLAVEVVGLAFVAAGEDLAPDADELGRLLVALRVVQKHAIAFELGAVAAGDEVDEQAAVGEAVEAGGHARGQRRLVQAGRTATRNLSRCVTGSRLAATTQGSSQERPVGINTPS